MIVSSGSADYAAIMSLPTITAIILAGGKGTRLGNVDKGFANYQGKPLIHHAIEKIEPQVQSIVISYNRNETAYKNLRHPCAQDLVSDYRGPLMGILSCAHLIRSEFLFAMPCDVPHLPANIVSTLLESLGDAELSVAHDGNRLQPLFFAGRTQVIESIQDFLDGGGRSVTKWIKSKDHVVVDFSSQQSAFWNINETSQLQQSKPL
jgi:molybdenum cofactor guanylyltransferase